MVPYPLWKRKKGILHHASEIIIDSGIMILKKEKEYPWINEYPLEATQNTWWVIPDYPHDIMMHHVEPEVCVQKSLENAREWYKEKGAVVSCQNKFLDFRDFVFNYDIFYDLACNGNRFLAIGNLCRCLWSTVHKKYIMRVLDHINSHNPEKIRIHVFGLSLFGIKYWLHLKPDYEFSADSMKWTRYLNRRSCRKDERRVYYRAYIEQIYNAYKRSMKQTRLF